MKKRISFISFSLQQALHKGNCLKEKVFGGLKRIGVYMIICCMLISMCPRVIHGTSIVAVKNAEELAAAIKAAPEYDETSIYVEGGIALANSGPTNSMILTNKNIHIIGTGTAQGASITSTKQQPFDITNSTLILENILIKNTYNNPTIQMNGDSILDMRADSVIDGGKGTRVSVGGATNQIIMNNGSVINATANGDAIYGGSTTLIMREGSLIQGDKSSSGVYLTGNYNHIIMDGGKIIDTNQGIGVDGGNNVIKLNKGSISGNNRCGIYIGGNDGANLLTMKDGMVIEDNHLSGVYIGANTTFTMDGGLIQNNTTTGYGGGINAGGNAQVVINKGSIINNTATYNGGGIHMEGASEGIANLNIQDAIITGNHASNGGGIYLASKSSLTLHKADISKNIATNDGGGIYQYYDVKLNLLGGNIHENTAASGAGIEISSNVDIQGNVTIQNNITNSQQLSNLYLRSNSAMIEISSALNGKIGFTNQFAKEEKKIAQAIGDYIITENDAKALQYDGEYGSIIAENKKSISLGAAAKDVTITKDILEELKILEVKNTLMYQIEAHSEDTTELRYEWYINTTPSYVGATLLAEAKDPQYTASFNETGTYYLFVKAINEKNHTKKEAYSKFAHLLVYEKKEDTGNIIGSIENEGDSEDLQGVTIEIYHKDKRIGKTTSDAHGGFAFNNLPYGIYNLVAQKGKQYITVKIEVKQQHTATSIKLANGNKNTVVESIGTTTPAVVVQGLNEMFAQIVQDPSKGIIEDDLKLLAMGGTIELRFIAQQKTKTEILREAEMIENMAKKDNKEIAMYLDLSIKKTLLNEGKTTLVDISEVGNNLEITIELSDALLAKKNLKVYRVHNNEVSTLPQDKGEEYFKVQGKYLIIYANKYSIYALGFDETRNNPIEGVGGNESETSKKQNASILTGDVSTLGGSTFALMSSFGVMAVAYHKLKREYIHEHDDDCFHGLFKKLKFVGFLCKQAFKDGLLYIKNHLFPNA